MPKTCGFNKINITEDKQKQYSEVLEKFNSYFKVRCNLPLKEHDLINATS